MHLKTGLVLEGGAMRGIYTAGVLDVLMERKLFFDAVIGVSAGAIHGCNYVSNQPGRSIRYYRKYSRDPRFLSVRSLLRTGNMVDTAFCYHELPEKLDPFDNEAFMASQTVFYAVCTNLETGRAECIRCTDLFRQIDVLRASASMPLASEIVEVEGKKYLDGGVADSVPLRAAEALGYERNVVVLTRPADYVKGREMNPLMRLRYRHYPAFLQAIENRPAMYADTMAYIRRREQEGAAFVIRPAAALPISRTDTDPEKLERVYQIGREDAEGRIEELARWLAE